MFWLYAGMKKLFALFSRCFHHCPSATLAGCCDLLKPESNQPVAVRMEGLLSESTKHITSRFCALASVSYLHALPNVQSALVAPDGVSVSAVCYCKAAFDKISPAGIRSIAVTSCHLNKCPQ